MKISDYTPVGIDGCFNISPSSLHTWYENRAKWFKDQILKQSSFRGNTNTVIGNIAHAVAEAYAKDDIVSDAEISEYLKQFKDNPDVDEWYIADNYKDVRLKVMEFMGTRPTPTKVEYQTIYSPKEGFSIGGSVDARTNSKLTDYKSCSSFPGKIKTEHKYQLLTYALVDSLNGVDTDTIEVVYIKKPDMKGTVSEKTRKIIGVKETEIRALSEPVTKEDLQEVKDELKLMMEIVALYQKDNSLAKYLFTENKLSFMK